jgi:hypothetical protein
MADSVENQLRSQFTKQLNEKTAGLAKLQSAEKQLTAEIATLRARIAKFDEVFAVGGVPTKTRRKPGPKPKTTVTAKTDGIKTTTRRKPGPKPKAVKVKAAAKTTTKATKVKGNNRATQGRRAVAQGLRPPIKKAMIEVMGKKTMNASEMYEALKAKNWLPDSSDPRAYISYLFSSLKESFERVEGKGRGYYRQRDVATTTAKTEKKAAKAETTTTTAATEVTTTTTADDVDDVLKEAGVIPSASPAN